MKSTIREVAKFTSISNVFNGKSVGEDIYHREVKGKRVKAENKRSGGRFSLRMGVIQREMQNN